MKTKKSNTSADVIVLDDITEKLDRAQALAYVLADAAGGDLGVEDENVHIVGLLIAKEIKQAHELLEQYEDKKRAGLKSKEAA